MKKILYPITLAGLLFLTSCSLQETSNDTSTLFSMPKWDDFSLTSSHKFREKILRDNGSYAFTTYDTRKNEHERIASDFSVHVYPPDTAPTGCTAYALGISNPKEREVEGTKIWTGLVDAYDIETTHDYVGETAPPCRPPDLTYSADPNDYGDSMTRIDNSAAYALCSEKDGKRVVVCVQQMTDNPELAEEIFSTFKWTK